MEELGAVKFMTKVGSSEEYEACYPKLFQGIQTFTGEYMIRLKPSFVPHAVHMARRIQILMWEAFKRELDDMVH